ncbi:hypothetical protein NDU88_002091 [Pleurodeles waltl]|uniref:Uncharacterized protein n=1 Tax=Pleurodeles waltl TaxID=8319 RepID=A0AAV7Q5Q8_PLEWA|nr:hypothetical protein NDU88_002091 [Pleurodeles waltl]
MCDWGHGRGKRKESLCLIGIKLIAEAVRGGPVVSQGRESQRRHEHRLECGRRSDMCIASPKLPLQHEQREMRLLRGSSGTWGRLPRQQCYVREPPPVPDTLALHALR